jgi:hypothetical protein
MGIHLLLLHEFRIGTIIDDVTPKYRGCQGRIDFLGTHIFELSVQDKVIALSTEINGSLLSQKDERENISILNMSHSSQG